jgi:hypothetical protein
MAFDLIGPKESPLAQTGVDYQRTDEVRPVSPTRSHVQAMVEGMEKSMANHRSERQKSLVMPFLAREGVGTEKSVADTLTGSNDSDAVSITSSTNVELEQARERYNRARLDLLEAEACSSKRSCRSQSSEGSDTCVSTPAGLAAVPKDLLESVLEAPALQTDSVRRKPRLNQDEEQPGHSAAKAAANPYVPAAARTPTDPQEGVTYNTNVVNQSTLNLETSVTAEVTKIHNEAQVYVETSRNEFRMEAKPYADAPTMHVRQQALVELANLLSRRQDAHRDEEAKALLHIQGNEARTAQTIASIQAEAARKVANAEKRVKEIQDLYCASLRQRTVGEVVRRTEAVRNAETDDHNVSAGRCADA